MTFDTESPARAARNLIRNTITRMYEGLGLRSVFSSFNAKSGARAGPVACPPYRRIGMAQWLSFEARRPGRRSPRSDRGRRGLSHGAQACHWQ
jgi:hypothetical protein